MGAGRVHRARQVLGEVGGAEVDAIGGSHDDPAVLAALLGALADAQGSVST